MPSKSVVIGLTYTFIRIHKTTAGTTWQVKENLTKNKIEQTRKNYHPQIINVVLVIVVRSHTFQREKKSRGSYISVTKPQGL